MKVRYRNDHEVTGTARMLHGLGETVVQFDEGDATSEYISNLEVEIDGEWMSLGKAFRTRQVLPNNVNTAFGRPRSQEDRERGYLL